jgi:hypothetical protein
MLTRTMIAFAAAAFAFAACESAARPSQPTQLSAPATPSSAPASVSPNESSASRAQSPATAGTLTPGFHRSVAFTPRLEFELPAGWTIIADGRDAYLLARGPGAQPAIVVQRNQVIGTNAQQCAGLAAPGASATVDGIVAAMMSDPRLQTSDAQPAAIGGVTGRVVDVQLASGWTGTCKWSGGQPAALVLTAAEPPGPFFGLGGHERAQLVLLDVGTDVVSIVIDSPDGSDFDELVSQATPILRTFRFAP